MEDPTTPTTWYLSRRIQLPLEAATTALDLLTGQLSPGRALGSLRLREALDAAPPGVSRRLPGRLFLAGLGRPVRVELELTPWSHHESELALRPMKRVPSRRATRYSSTAVTTLDAVRAELGRAERPRGRPGGTTQSSLVTGASGPTRCTGGRAARAPARSAEGSAAGLRVPATTSQASRRAARSARVGPR